MEMTYGDWLFYGFFAATLMFIWSNGWRGAKVKMELMNMSKTSNKLEKISFDDEFIAQSNEEFRVSRYIAITKGYEAREERNIFGVEVEKVRKCEIHKDEFSVDCRPSDGLGVFHLIIDDKSDYEIALAMNKIITEINSVIKC